MTARRLVIAGAGLSAALIAQRLAGTDTDTDTDITIIEASTRPFGEHTWSFHSTDVAPADHDWLAPLVAKRWAGQSVLFPDRQRRFSTGYNSLSSASVAAAMAANPRVTIETGAHVVSLEPGAALLGGGRRVEADCVIDARGFRRHPALLLGFQKFLGLEVETPAPHGIAEPLIMDATVEQLDGYRFVYLLPFSDTRILIEDTRYSDTGALDTDRLSADIAAYADARGWDGYRVVRREAGVLPIALAYDQARYWADRPADIPIVGMAAALFHPTTGYSLGEAVRVANLVAAAWPTGSAALAAKLRAHAARRSREQWVYRLLSRLLFKAATPEQRRKVLSHFFRLPQPVVERFYAGRTTLGDAARIFVGRPPVPVGKALRVFTESALLRAKA